MSDISVSLIALIVRLVLQIEECHDDSEGRSPAPDPGCIDCTAGTVPNRLNTGQCAYHAARHLLVCRGELPLVEKARSPEERG